VCGIIDEQYLDRLLASPVLFGDGVLNSHLS
jgi:hypothetical protein